MSAVTMAQLPMVAVFWGQSINDYFRVSVRCANAALSDIASMRQFLYKLLPLFPLTLRIHFVFLVALMTSCPHADSDVIHQVSDVTN